MSGSKQDAKRYVRENRETLIEIIIHGSDQFVRALAFSALMEFGKDPDLEKLRQEIDRMEKSEESG